MTTCNATRSCPPLLRTLLLKQILGILCGVSVAGLAMAADALSIEGVHVVPHVQSSEMRYRQKPDFSLGARVQLFRVPSASVRDGVLRGRAG